MVNYQVRTSIAGNLSTVAVSSFTPLTLDDFLGLHKYLLNIELTEHRIIHFNKHLSDVCN